MARLMTKDVKEFYGEEARSLGKKKYRSPSKVAGLFDSILSDKTSEIMQTTSVPTASSRSAATRTVGAKSLRRSLPSGRITPAKKRATRHTISASRPESPEQEDNEVEEDADDMSDVLMASDSGGSDASGSEDGDASGSEDGDALDDEFGGKDSDPDSDTGILGAVSDEDEGSLEGDEGDSAGDDEDGSESAGDEDLDGLQLASRGGVQGEGSKRSKKQRVFQPSEDVMTKAHTDKLGLAFDRVLNKSSKTSVLLSASKSVQKRRAEEADETAAAKKAKTLRMEMRQRGHVTALVKGKDPAQDAKEKLCTCIATKAVVQLFNAISGAQKQQREAEEAGTKDKDTVKQTKAALLSILKPGTKAPKDAPAPGWQVLQDGYTGLQSNTKLKDWDREAAAKEDDIFDQVADQEGSDSEDFEDW